MEAIAIWSRVFTEQMVTVEHSAGSVELYSESGCIKFIHSSEFEFQNSWILEHQFKHSVILLPASLHILGSRIPIFVTELKASKSHKSQMLTLYWASSIHITS
jgi:hypothetical protein